MLLTRIRWGPPAPLVARPLGSGVEEVERDICFILGLLAIKIEHQTAICAAGALPTLVSMIKRYAVRNDVALAGVHAQTCRRAADAVTNLAHENNTMKNKVRQEGGIPPLVTLLHSVDPKVQRAVAGSLRTLAFKNEENKNIIVDLGSLPLLIQMLRSEDSTIHYEAVGVIGNLVHSSANIKKRVLEEGALQAVINLLSSPCPDSQREAALLLGQFATGARRWDRSGAATRGAAQLPWALGTGVPLRCCCRSPECPGQLLVPPAQAQPRSLRPPACSHHMAPVPLTLRLPPRPPMQPMATTRARLCSAARCPL